MNSKLDETFFQRDALLVAKDIVGKVLVHRLADGTEIRERIAESEAYRGEEDLACHASKGRTPRTELLYGMLLQEKTASLKEFCFVRERFITARQS